MMKKDPKTPAKPRKLDPKDQKIAELTEDLQRQRADFENYRKRTDEEKVRMKAYGEEEMIKKLLPIFDNLDRALQHFPEDLKDNAWAQGVQNLPKNLAKIQSDIGLTKIIATPDTPFDHNTMNAVMADDVEGEREVVAEELQPGYQLNGQTLREATVRVTRK